MEIKDIKNRLGIMEVLQHYGLRPDKNGRLKCPFHPDKTPSLQVYPKTNTYCCFSSNCSAGTGDAIQFIELYEKCSKHEALKKATELAGLYDVETTPTAPATLLIETDSLTKSAVLSKAFGLFKKALPLTKRAVEYLQSRSLDYKQHETGFINAGYHHELTKELTESLAKFGLLKPKPSGGFTTWAKDCIVFPLKNQEGKIVSLYGRSTSDQHDQRHFYLTGREGLYPGYPTPTTTKLILTESIIDAASLLQLDGFSVLALYGTNGLTDEHIKAITALQSLEEVILMLNADAPGEAATQKHAQALHALLPHIRITCVHLPAGEDVNSVLCTHDDASVLQSLINERTSAIAEACLPTRQALADRDFSFSSETAQSGSRTPLKNNNNESEQNKKPAETPAVPASQPNHVNHPNPKNHSLDTRNAELLIYQNCQLQIEVLGGIRITGLDRMKVTLKVTHLQKQALPVRHTLDLYHRQQTEQLIETIAENFDVNIKQTAGSIGELTNELEAYRLERIEALQPKKDTRPELTEAQKQAAINELKRENLLQRTGQLIGLSGIVGEETNRLIAYLVYSSRKRQNPLHIMFLGSSGSGKTYLQEKVSELIPEEDKQEITQVTENAFYYFKQDELKYKLLLIEDLDGAESSQYPIRELQSKKRISKTVTLKDNKGNLKTITVKVEGPVSVSSCTTKEKVYEDNANRCLLLYVDQCKDQDKRIMEYQTKLSAGEVNHDQEQKIKALMQAMQRMLLPVEVVNPYARFIQLPEQIFKPRRTMSLLLGFIETVTWYHQYQRPVKSNGAGHYIETSIEDIEQSFALIKDVLFTKGDELAKATRQFLEQLKHILKSQNRESITAKEIRHQLRINPSNLKRYLIELERYGYIKGQGNRYRSYEYSVTNFEEYEALKGSIDGQLTAIVERIKESVSGSVVQ
jgi:DNA primase catalytic core